MAKSVIKLVQALTGDRWEVWRTIWPYEDGYGVYNPHTRTLLESGLSKEQAQEICDAQNQL